MRLFTFEQATRIFGVALLISAGFSAGMRHAHPGGGGWSHDHDFSTLATGVTTEGTGAGWFATPLHMHIFLLGFQFTLPAEEPSQGDEDPAGQPEMMQLASHDLVESAARLPAGNSDDAIAFDVQLDACANSAADIRLARPRLEIAGPLCESARHERSGVLRT